MIFPARLAKITDPGPPRMNTLPRCSHFAQLGASHFVRKIVSLVVVGIVAAIGAPSRPAQGAILLPELFYYKFNEGSGTLTANSAAPGVGSNPATVAVHT